MTAEKELDPDASLWHLLAFELREARKTRGWTQATLAREAHSSETHVGAVETLARKPKLEMIEAYDAALGTNGRLARLFRAAQRASRGKPGWWESFKRTEQMAVRIRTFEPQAIPGLLQHEGYIRESFRQSGMPRIRMNDEVVERLERQAAVLASETPPRYWAVIDEAAFVRLVHLPPEVARAQLEHLVALTEESHATIQVLPLNCGLHACLNGGFVLLSVAGRGEVCYAETVSSEGHIVTDEYAVRELEGRYDLMRSEAMSPRQSAQFMKDLLETL